MTEEGEKKPTGITILPDLKGDLRADTKDAADVFNRLLDKMSAGLGTLYEPVHKVRMAKAEGKALIIEAEAKGKAVFIETDAEVERARRAMARLVQQETRKQENIESVVEGAKDKLDPNATPENLDEDWLAQFAERASKVSDKELQKLWSKILAGETNTPKSYRKDTINKLAELEKDDLELFKALCRFVLVVGKATPLIIKPDDEIYTKFGIDFTALCHLRNLGLIEFLEIGARMRTKMPQQFRIHYGAYPYDIKLREGDSVFQIGQAEFTVIGLQLFALSDAPVVPEFPQYLARFYQQLGVQMTGAGIQPQPPA